MIGLNVVNSKSGQTGVVVAVSAATSTGNGSIFWLLVDPHDTEMLEEWPATLCAITSQYTLPR